MPLSKISGLAAAAALLLTTTVQASENIISKPLSELEWKTSKEGVGFASLEGNRFNEAYMAMVKLPAGLISPTHKKTANMYGLVVSGTIVNVAVGASPDSEIKLPAGSYYKIPASLAHVSKCVSNVDCVTFLYQDGKFDFLPVTP